MHRVPAVFVSIVLFCSSLAAQQNQPFSSQVQPPARTQAGVDQSPDCEKTFELQRAARMTADSGLRLSHAPADSSNSQEYRNTAYESAFPTEDLAALDQNLLDLARCMLAKNLQAQADGISNACFAELLLNFEMRHDGEPERDIPIGHLPGNTAFFYESGMTIDADGAPNAYHPDNLGLDDLSNAGSPGNWPGLAKDANGEPFIQGPDDPFPGYYVSETALADRSKPVNDPTRYVDASKIPFVVLPGGMARQLGARPGDFALVFNQRNGKGSYAIFGDVGPPDRIGEGSMALAENLGIRSDARNGGARRGILYLVFPGSGNGRPRTVEEINAETRRLMQDWEDSAPPETCSDQRSSDSIEGNQGAN